MKRWWGRTKRSDVDKRRPRDDAQRSIQALNTHYLRSRTISSYQPQATPDLARLSAHELRSHRRRLVRTLIGCIVVIAALGFIVSQLTSGTGSISYVPGVVRPPDETSIKKAVNEYYQSRPLERLRFLLNEQTLGQFLASKVPEVQGVKSVGPDGIGMSRLALSMRTPIASWKTGDQTVYVDSTGASFTSNYYAAPAVEVDDQSGASVSGSSAIASSSMIRYIGQLIAALQSNGTGTVTRVVLPAGMIRELDVYVQGREYRVKVQLDRDVALQAADVKVALSYIDAHGGAKEYVDVRVAGKAYYK